MQVLEKSGLKVQLACPLIYLTEAQIAREEFENDKSC